MFRRQPLFYLILMCSTFYALQTPVLRCGSNACGAGILPASRSIQPGGEIPVPNDSAYRDSHLIYWASAQFTCSRRSPARHCIALPQQRRAHCPCSSTIANWYPKIIPDAGKLAPQVSHEFQQWRRLEKLAPPGK